MSPGVDALIEAGARSYQAGDWAGAARQLAEAARRAPKRSDALYLLGLCALRLGHPDEALRCMDAAVAADKRDAVAWTNRARVLTALRRVGEAEDDLRRALRLRPTLHEARLGLARHRLAAGAPAEAAALAAEVLRAEPAHLDAARVEVAARLEAGEPGRAAEIAEAALRFHPADAPLRADLGTARALLGEADAAFAAWSAAVALRPELAGPLARARREAGEPERALALLRGARVARPDDAELHNEAGNAAQEAGRPDEALAAWREALRADPAHAAAHHNLASALARAGQAEGALPHHLAAVAADPDDHPAWVALLDTLAALDDPGPTADAALLGAFARDGLDHQLAERAVRRALARDPAIARALATGTLDDPAASALIAHPLTVPWLSRSLVRGADWEALIGQLRSRAAEAPLALLEALALQAWYNEYAWRPAVEALDPTTPRELATFAMGASPEPFGAQAQLWAGLDALRAATVEAPARERALAATLPKLGPVTDATSLAVQAMYEESPYPRLVSAHRKPPAPLGRLLRGLFPHHAALPPVPDAPEVLIAGCGTGQQALSTARRYAGARVLAVDLSRASLGRAARRAEEEGLDNLRFAHADLLALGDLPERFDLVEAGGVLHHLADPMAGWRVLTHLTRPGGLQRVAMYSEAGRAAVVAARALVASWGLEPDPHGLREARARFLALPADHPARGVVHSPDFTSLSGLRDLVFHVMEHRYTLLQLQAMTAELGLELLGLQHPVPVVSAWYAARWPDDLEQRDWARWHALEQEHPEAFAGMVQMWLWKPGAAP